MHGVVARGRGVEEEILPAQLQLRPRIVGVKSARAEALGHLGPVSGGPLRDGDEADVRFESRRRPPSRPGCGSGVNQLDRHGKTSAQIRFENYVLRLYQIEHLRLHLV